MRLPPASDPGRPQENDGCIVVRVALIGRLEDRPALGWGGQASIRRILAQRASGRRLAAVFAELDAGAAAYTKDASE